MTAKQLLHSTLWAIADELRGKMGADEFRDYILGFIFYKFLSEKMHRYANQWTQPDGFDYRELEERKDKEAYLKAIRDMAVGEGDKPGALGYFLKPSELFSEMVRRGTGKDENAAEEEDLKAQSNFILDDLTKVLRSIEQSTMGTASEEDFENLFEDLDLTSSKLGRTEKDKNDLVVRIIARLNKVDFELDNPKHDVLGDAYEYLIGKFASGAGKKAGEFYTPQEVSTVLAKIVTTGKKRLRNVYDPTCGSGSLLLRVAKEVMEVGEFYGQESNPTTFNLCRMNMIMHDVHYSKFDIKNEDTLERPQHIGMKFEAVVANPPFSANWNANPLKINDDRFSSYGRLAPATKADFAFLQHMYHHSADDATVACILPHGVLFRGAAEGQIRQFFMDNLNALHAIIGLPANLFFGTSIPTSIIVLKKKREKSDRVLFIDASQHFEKVKNQNMLRAEDIDKIVETYRMYETGRPELVEGRGVLEPKYSYIASLEEIRENDYNLNIPRYVDTFEEEEQVNLAEMSKELKGLEKDIQQTDQVIAGFCKELGIEAPF